MTIWIALIIWLVAGDSGSADSRYLRVFDLVSSLPETTRFLGVDGLPSNEQALAVSDSVYSLDPFPFGQEIQAAEVSIYHADMLGPVRAVFSPDLARVPFPADVRGIVYISLAVHDTVIAEVFPFHREFRSYEQYCISSDGMKYLLWAPATGPVHLLRVVHLLR